MSQLFSSEHGEKSIYSKLSFPRRLSGTLLGNKIVLSDLKWSENWPAVIAVFFFTFLANIGLSILALRLLYSPDTFAIVLSSLWGKIVFFCFLHLLFWVLATLIYHGMCRLSGGKASLIPALTASSFIYLFTPILLLLVSLVAILILKELFWAMTLVELLMLVLAIWRVVVIIKSTKIIYELSLSTSILIFFVLSIIAGVVLLVSYFAFMAYLAVLMGGII